MDDDALTPGPHLLMSLAHVEDSKESILAALKAELRSIDPSDGALVEPTTIAYLVAALDQRAPDGWGFDVEDGEYGFWCYEPS
jgi:hypothetical protein